MTSILNRIFGRRKRGSSTTAKDRLRFVLQHDRINLPPERMEQMKTDILAVIVKYVVVDKDHVEIDLQQLDRSHSKLVAEIPLVNQLAPPSPENDGKPKASKSNDVKPSSVKQTEDKPADDQQDKDGDAGDEDAPDQATEDAEDKEK